MRITTILGIIVLAAVSQTARAQSTSSGCVERAAAVISNPRTTPIESVKLAAGNPMPPLAAGEPVKFEVFVLVDTMGRADSTTIKLPAGLDDYSSNSIRKVLPSWRFIPAMVGSCPVRQVLKLTFSRK